MTILLMTGTISPPKGARELARANVADRIADYKVALQHNLCLLREGVISGLAFVENSGYGMADFERTVTDSGLGDQVELISYDARQSEDEPRFMGECHLLREAFAQSELVHKSNDSHVWKITGRYVVRNLAAILRKTQGNNDLILHCRNYPMRFVDFGLVGFARKQAPTIIERVLGSGSLKFTDERIMRDMIDKGAFKDMKVCQRMSEVPDFAGVRGIDNSSYDSFGYRMRYQIRSVLHKTMPWVWV